MSTLRDTRPGVRDGQPQQFIPLWKPSVETLWMKRGGRGGCLSLFDCAIRVFVVAFALTLKTKPGLQEKDIWKLLTAAEKDFRSGMAKLTEVRAQLSNMNLPEPKVRVKCRHCGVSLTGERTLAEHLYQLHDGPEPEHWLEAEKRSAHEPA